MVQLPSLPSLLSSSTSNNATPNFLLLFFQYLTILSPLIYIALTLTAILSIYSTSLTRLASHGKTRLQNTNSNSSCNSNSDSDSCTSTSFNLAKKKDTETNSDSGTAQNKSPENGFAERIIHYVIENEKFQIPKKRFIDFYIVGLTWTTLVHYYYCHHHHRHHDYYTLSREQQEKSASPSASISISSNYNNTTTTTSTQVQILLLYVHLSRRIYECQNVHAWNTNVGKMHFMGYILGLVHYMLLPFIFLPFAIVRDSNENYNNYVADDQSHDTIGTGTIYRFGSRLILGWLLIAFNLYSQWEQYNHHTILALCRHRQKLKQHSHESRNNENDNESESDNSCGFKNNSNNKGRGGEHDDEMKNEFYTIPHGRWFQFVSCPHYTAEIMIYISFAVVSNIFPHFQTATMEMNLIGMDGITEWKKIRIVRSIMRWTVQYRQWIVIVWVFTNLAISARSTHHWYQTKFGPRYPKERRALIPFIW